MGSTLISSFRGLKFKNKPQAYKLMTFLKIVINLNIYKAILSNNLKEDDPAYSNKAS